MNWDQAFLLNRSDTSVIEKTINMPLQRVFVMPCDPTPRGMAEHLLTDVLPAMIDGNQPAVTAVAVEDVMEQNTTEIMICE